MKTTLALVVLFLGALCGSARAESTPDSFGKCMYFCQQYGPEGRNRCMETLCGSLAPKPEYDGNQANGSPNVYLRQQALNSLAVQIAQAEARLEAARLRIEETRPRVASFDPFASRIVAQGQNPEYAAAQAEFEAARKALIALQDGAQSLSSLSPIE